MLHRILACSLAILLCGIGGAWADEETLVEGTLHLGTHYLDGQDFLGRVGEYVELGEEEEIRPDLELELTGATPSTLLRIEALYENRETNGFGLDLFGSDGWRADIRLQSFVHNLDRDHLTNLQARELVYTDGVPGPGGKQVYNSDSDPTGVYGIRYERFDGNFAWDLPWLKGATLYSGYHDQRRDGYKQVMGIDHCAFCHVESDGRRIDEQTQVWRSGVKASTDRVAFHYEYKATHFTDHTEDPSRYYGLAVHPVSGLSGAEFTTRLNFDGQEESYAQRPTSTRQTHDVGLSVTLPRDNVLRAGYTRSDGKNENSSVESTLDAFVAAWITRPTKKSSVKARFLAYETKVDDVYVDLDLYRDGRSANPLDFDWTRISAANRQVLQGDLDASLRLPMNSYVKASYRYKMVDRDAMNQSQTSYLDVDDVAVEVPSEAFADKTIENRFRLIARTRLGQRGSVQATGTLSLIDDPFMNVTAMCEEGLNGTDITLPDEPYTYYFQRQRYGMGTDRPSLSQRYSLRGSYQIHARGAVSAYGTLGLDENDDLNVYSFERTMISAGVNAWAAPEDRLLLTVGYTLNRVESNAHLCPPLFDG